MQEIQASKKTSGKEHEHNQNMTGALGRSSSEKVNKFHDLYSTVLDINEDFRDGEEAFYEQLNAA